MMRPAEMTVLVDGWPLQIDDSNEPRVRDLELAERLGYERPRKIRELIERMVAAGKLNDIHQRPTVGRYEIRPGVWHPGQSVTEFWLTEAQALKVAAKSETEPADAILDEMIRVFMLARRGLLPRSDVPPAPPERAVADALASAVSEGDHTRARTLHGALWVLLGRPSARSGEALAAPGPEAPELRQRVLEYVTRESAAGRAVPGKEALAAAVGGRAASVRAAVEDLQAQGAIVNRPERLYGRFRPRYWAAGES